MVIFAVGALAAAMIIGGAFISANARPTNRWTRLSGDVVMWVGIALAVLLVGYMFGHGMAD